MLSVEDCRKHLDEDGKTNLTDEQVENLRDAMYAFIEPIVDKHFEDCRKSKVKSK